MRWIRLDIGWSSSDWLAVLSAESRLAWIEILCYVKAYGGSGRAKAVNPALFARRIFVGEESVMQVLKAAELHGALTIEGGEWVISKWREYQADESNAERQARYRERKRGPDVTDRNERNALRNAVTPTETETETETETPPLTPPLPSGGADKSPSESGGEPQKRGRGEKHQTFGAADVFELLPEVSQTPLLRDACESYDRYRKARRQKPWVYETVVRTLAAWTSYEPDVLVRAISASIEKGWTGIFPERFGKPVAPEGPPPEPEPIEGRDFHYQWSDSVSESGELLAERHGPFWLIDGQPSDIPFDPGDWRSGRFPCPEASA